MKKSELMITSILVPLDFLMVFVGSLAAYQLRFGGAVADIRPVVYAMPLEEFLKLVLAISPIFLLSFALGGLYHVTNLRKIASEFSRIILASSTAVLIFTIFLQRELFSSRFIILTGWIFVILAVFIARQLVRILNRSLLRRGIGIHHVIIFGLNHATEEMLKYLRVHPEKGYRVAAHFSSFTAELRGHIESIVQTQEIDEVIVADPTLPKNEINALLDFANEHHINFRYVPDMFGTKITNLEIDTLVGVPIIEVKRTPLDGWGRILKRLVDIVCSILLLILLSPLFLLVAFAIKIDSAGGVFFSSARVGYKGRPLHVYKFRSMIANAHALKKELIVHNERADGPLFKMSHDPRVTRLGRFLRKTSIDELPQLWNVLRGEMSLVGPRPHEPEEVAQYKKHHKRVLFVKPGVTGMAQVSGRSDLTFEQEVRLDTFYIENWSLWRDIQILFKTLWVVIRRQAAV